MYLSELVKTLNVQTQAKQRWVILGPEAEAFRPKLQPATVDGASRPAADGILLAAALSSEAEPSARLIQIAAELKEGATLVVVDWQTDGPLDIGPDLKRRLNRGRVCRILRQGGFGTVGLAINHPHYYVVRAVKGPAAPVAPLSRFVDVAGLDELPKNAMKLVDLLGQKIIVANTGREIVAFAQTCPHANGHLDQGRLRGRNVVCPVHYYIWNVRSGEPVEPADEDILTRYAVRIDEKRSRVLVAPAPLSASS